MKKLYEAKKLLAVATLVIAVMGAATAAHACDGHAHESHATPQSGGSITQTATQSVEQSCPPNCDGDTDEGASNATDSTLATSNAGDSAFGVWAYRWVVHYGCGWGAWYSVQIGATNFLWCPHCGWSFSAFIPY